LQLKNERRKLKSHLDTVVPEELTYSIEGSGFIHVCACCAKHVLTFSIVDLNCFHFLAGCSEAVLEFWETFWKTNPFQRAFRP